MATVHTFGRDLNFHVHVHVLCTAGGLRADNVWQPVKIFPAQQYRRLWQYYLLTLLRKKLKGEMDGLAGERAAWLKKQAGAKRADSFDTRLVDALKVQAAKKGIVY